MKHLHTIWRFISTLNREAAFDSLKNILAVIGFGSMIGNFATMQLLYAVPLTALGVGVWYGDYIRHDFEPVRTAIESVAHLREELDNGTQK